MKADRENFIARAGALSREALLALAVSQHDELEEMRTV